MVSQILLNGVSLDGLLERIGQLIDAKISHLPQTTTTQKQSDYITRKEVAALLKVSLQTLHDYSKLGYVKSYKIGSRVLYKKAEVLAALEQVQSFKHKKGGLCHG